MNETLSGRVALVTGAAQGIGEAIALVLAEQGADVIVNDRLENNQGLAVCAAIRAMGRRSTMLAADVGNEAEVKRMFCRIDEEFGHLDILVNNAGSTKAQTIEEASLDNWNELLSVNLTSCFLCSKEALARMKARHFGRIVNISSMAGQQGALLGHIHYSASKSGMLGFTKTLARTAGPMGITVNAVAPGLTDTELLRKTHSVAELEMLTARMPTGVLGQARHVGLAVAFLCGEAGSSITGSTLDMNGGIYMR